MTDHNALCERLDRHWLTNSYPVGPAATMEEVVSDCREAARIIRELSAKRLCACVEEELK